MNTATSAGPRIFYGWIVLAASVALIAVGTGTIFSLAVFLRPLEEEFGWSRALISGIALVNWVIFGVGSFGIAAYVAEAAGDLFTTDHTESDTRHEELFFVASGRASISVAGETVDAPAGTLVYISDPAVARGATAVEAGTTLLVVGGEPGKPFEVSAWEREYIDG